MVAWVLKDGNFWPGNETVADVLATTLSVLISTSVYAVVFALFTWSRRGKLVMKKARFKAMLEACRNPFSLWSLRNYTDGDSGSGLKISELLLATIALSVATGMTLAAGYFTRRELTSSGLIKNGEYGVELVDLEGVASPEVGLAETCRRFPVNKQNPLSGLEQCLFTDITTLNTTVALDSRVYLNFLRSEGEGRFVLRVRAEGPRCIALCGVATSVYGVAGGLDQGYVVHIPDNTAELIQKKVDTEFRKQLSNKSLILKTDAIPLFQTYTLSTQDATILAQVAQSLLITLVRVLKFTRSGAGAEIQIKRQVGIAESGLAILETTSAPVLAVNIRVPIFVPLTVLILLCGILIAAFPAKMSSNRAAYLSALSEVLAKEQGNVPLMHREGEAYICTRAIREEDKQAHAGRLSAGKDVGAVPPGYASGNANRTSERLQG